MVDSGSCHRSVEDVIRDRVDELEPDAVTPAVLERLASDIQIDTGAALIYILNTLQRAASTKLIFDRFSRATIRGAGFSRLAADVAKRTDYTVRAVREIIESIALAVGIMSQAYRDVERVEVRDRREEGRLDACVQVLEGIYQGRLPRKDIAAYLNASMYHGVRDRGRKREPITVPGDELEVAAACVRDAGHGADLAVIEARAIAYLKHRGYPLLALQLEGVMQREIADRRAVSESTISRIIRKERNRLRGSLDEFISHLQTGAAFEAPADAPPP